MTSRSFNIPIARSRSTCANFVTVNKQFVILNSKVFKCFFDVWDVRLAISVVSTRLNLNGLSLHVKNREMENPSVHWFWMTHLNKSIGKMSGRQIAKYRQMMKFCHSHLTHNIFSSPEPKAHGWANSIPVTPASVRRPSVRPQFQTYSPLKPLGQLNSNYIWRLLRTRERKFVQMVLVKWPRWPPRPYMVKTL